MTLASPSKRSHAQREPLTTIDESKAPGSSSHGITRYPPSLYDRPRVHSRTLRRALIGPSVRPDDISFRPRGFSPPRRLSPRGGCGFVAPRCQPWGSSRFLRRATWCVRRRPGRRPFSPRRGSHPSKGSPRQQPYRITAAVALLPFPSIPSPTTWARHEAESVSRTCRRGGQPVDAPLPTEAGGVARLLRRGDGGAWTGRRPRPTPDSAPPKRHRCPRGTPKRLADPASPRRSAGRIRRLL